MTEVRRETREPAVFDTGPLIYLDAIGYLDVLRELHRVVIPQAVAGERETIALALETGATAVMDDRRGRRRARSLGVPVTGTLGVLQAIHRTGHAGRGFAEDLAALGSAGMYLTAELRQRVFDRFHAGDAPRERT